MFSLLGMLLLLTPRVEIFGAQFAVLKLKLVRTFSLTILKSRCLPLAVNEVFLSKNGTSQVFIS